jgi:hypothetical protein
MTDKQLQQQILDTSAIEKILKVAETSTGTIEFPHLTTFGCTEYKYEPLTWWTSGFFPGSLWVILERYHKSKQLVDGVSIERIEKLANEWKDKLKGAEYNTNTHDIGFLIMPAYQRHYELTGDKASAKAIVQAAESLLTRWNEKVQCLRSWNKTQCKNYQFMSQDRDFLVIIDNMMNLDLLYSASLISGDPKYADIATRHSETTLKNHVRSDWSTYHLIVYDPVTGEKKIGLTHQGYDHESTWSRGQAWALYGFATVYKYTKQTKFLDAAKNLADHFISRLEDGVVYWDFDAPRPCVWDTSAATIACSGMLLICQLAEPDKKYLDAVNSMLKKCVDGAIAPPNTVTILDHATTNNYRYSLKPFADHGLVYADYYFLEAGNRLIDLNLV